MTSCCIYSYRVSPSVQERRPLVGARQLTARGGESEAEDGGTGERPEVDLDIPDIDLKIPEHELCLAVPNI